MDCPFCSDVLCQCVVSAIWAKIKGENMWWIKRLVYEVNSHFIPKPIHHANLTSLYNMPRMYCTIPLSGRGTFILRFHPHPSSSFQILLARHPAAQFAQNNSWSCVLCWVKRQLLRQIFYVWHVQWDLWIMSVGGQWWMPLRWRGGERGGTVITKIEPGRTWVMMKTLKSTICSLWLDWPELLPPCRISWLQWGAKNRFS